MLLSCDCWMELTWVTDRNFLAAPEQSCEYPHRLQPGPNSTSAILSVRHSGTVWNPAEKVLMEFHGSLMREIGLLFQFYRWGHGRLKWLSNMLEVIWLAMWKAALHPCWPVPELSFWTSSSLQYFRFIPMCSWKCSLVLWSTANVNGSRGGWTHDLGLAQS